MLGEPRSAPRAHTDVVAPFRDASHVVSDLEHTHLAVSVTPGADPSLRYVLPVPRGWSHVWGRGPRVAPGQPEIIGLFAPAPDRHGPSLVVSVTRLRWDVDPVLWVADGWQAEGWELAVARPLPPRWHPRFEVGALRIKAGEIQVRRTVGFIDDVAGFGAIDGHWAGRACFAGTFDAAWREKQRPRLPLDLDPRFFSAASPGLGSAVSLFGELEVELVHVSTEPVLRFRLPDVRVQVDFQLAGRLHERRAELWTIVLEPDERRVTMSWGARCRVEQRRSSSDRIEIRNESSNAEQVIPHAS
jgi:hypothetical protein